MDIQRKGTRRRKIIKLTVAIVLGVGVLTAGFVFASKLKPAAPGVELSTLWPDTVKRGPMIREVHGLGTLVPEDTMLITASTDGRVERILIKPGTPVKADSVVMILSSPELQVSLLDAEFAQRGAEADYNTAKLESDRDTALAKENLLANTDAKISQVKAQQLGAKFEIDKERLQINDAAEQAQLEAQKVKVDQLRGEYELKKQQVDQLKVRAGFEGMLQSVPPPLTAVEEGQKVMAGTALTFWPS